jgi:hypothetical protein
MKSGEKQIPLENLRKFTHVATMDGTKGWDSEQLEALYQALSESEQTTFIGCLAEAFGLDHPKTFAIGDLVRIIALPPSRTMDDKSEEIRTFATYYGYAAVVTGRGLFGGEIYFIGHGALALASATETFSKLSSLR